MANIDRSREQNRGNVGAGADDWATEEKWWRENYANRPYASADLPFDHYSPAYRYGYDAASRHRGREWHDVETDLEKGWDDFREERGGGMKAKWEDIKHAVKDAWDHVTGGEHEKHRGSEREVSPETRL